MMLLEGVMALEQGAAMMEGELPADAIPIPWVKVRPGNLRRSYHQAAQADHNWDNADRVWSAQQESLYYSAWARVVVAMFAGAPPSPAQRYAPHL